MEHDPQEAKTTALPDQQTQVRAETRNLNQKDFGQTERQVRALIGVPIAFASIYARHYSVTASIALGVIGLYLAGTSVWHYCPVRHLVYWTRWKQSIL